MYFSVWRDISQFVFQESSNLDIFFPGAVSRTEVSPENPMNAEISRKNMLDLSERA